MKRTLTIACALVLLTAIAFRLLGLSNLPGINGDEAWTGVQVMRLIRDEGGTMFTGNGKLDNPFYFALLYLTHLLLDPSFFALRLPAALGGILLIPLAYWLGLRLTGDRTTAWILTLLVACMPINLAYSRFGVGPSQLPLAALITSYFALRRNWPGMIVSFICACLVHPTMVFSGCILIGPAVAAFIASDQYTARQKKRLLVGALLSAVFLLGLLLLLSPRFYLLMRTRGIGHRMRNPQILLQFLMHYGGMISGTTTYTYLVGPQSTLVRVMHDATFWLVALGVSITYWRKAKDDPLRVPLIGLAAGLCASFFASYFIGGINAIKPSLERYSLYLASPTLMLLALMAGGLRGRLGEQRLKCGALVIGVLWLISFQLRFFVPLRQDGGNSERTGRTARIEPKQQAFERLIADAGDKRPLLIITQDWWNFWPIRYLSFNQHNVRVTTISPLLPYFEPQQIYPIEQVPQAIRDGAYFIGFIGKARVTTEIRRLPPGSLKRITILDAGGRELLGVWRIK